MITWKVSEALILIAMSQEKSSQRLLTLGIRCVFTDELDEPIEVLIDDGLGIPYLMRIQAQRIALMASMSIHCPRTSQSSWAFSAMLFRSSMVHQLLFGGVLFTIRVDRVEAHPNSL